jgi:hypothetical protein
MLEYASQFLKDFSYCRTGFGAEARERERERERRTKKGDGKRNKTVIRRNKTKRTQAH